MTGRGPAPQDLVERALDISAADECIVIADAVTEANLRWANNSLTTNGVARSRQVTVISVVGSSVGVVTEEGVTEDSLAGIVEAAEQTARAAPEAEDRAPIIGAEASRGDWGAAPAETSIGVFSRFAPDLGDAFERASRSDQLLFGYAEHQMRSTYIGSSRGLRSRFDQPTAHAEVNAKSADHARSAWAGVPSFDFTDIDMAALTSELARQLDWASRRFELPAGRYETILPPSAVADLMIPLYWSAGARDANEGRTVFSRPGGGTRVGDRLSDLTLDLRSDPYARPIQCAPFAEARSSSSAASVFDNGSPLAPTSWISGGVLAALVQTRHSAQVTELPFTPYVDNLILDGPATGRGTPADLVAGTERGLLLTCLWYIREVDPQTQLLTGLTRDGVYLVESGEVVGA
ncbi:MAG TPA: metallopeptidase TldD-related protein, partial [Acidimicrobiales bacterium]|nr:metallopeptidase TldD-related protein [Acidimicrobiales bacterium]